jgi:addiction module HigA family antidote
MIFRLNSMSMIPHPGECLQRHFLNPLRLTAYRVAKETGITPIALSQILRGTRSVSPGTALKLGKYFGTGPMFWWRLQALCDLLRTENDGACDNVDRCAVLAEIEVVVKEISGPTGCWRSATWEVQLKTKTPAKKRLMTEPAPDKAATKTPHQTADHGGPPAKSEINKASGKAEVTPTTQQGKTGKRSSGAH